MGRRHGNKLIASPEKLRGFGGTSQRLVPVNQEFVSPRGRSSTTGVAKDISSPISDHGTEHKNHDIPRVQNEPCDEGLDMASTDGVEAICKCLKKHGDCLVAFTDFEFAQTADGLKVFSIPPSTKTN